jgi:hypothetical protein
MGLDVHKTKGKRMMDEFMKLLSKKMHEQKGPHHGPKMDAKAAMAKELSDSLGADITEGIKGLKKVTVASDSEEGLKKGLEKAEEAIGEQESEDEEMGEKDKPKMEGYEDQQEESEPLEKDDVADKIKELEKQLQELKAKR